LTGVRQAAGGPESIATWLFALVVLNFVGCLPKQRERKPLLTTASGHFAATGPVARWIQSAL